MYEYQEIIETYLDWSINKGPTIERGRWEKTQAQWDQYGDRWAHFYSSTLHTSVVRALE